MDFYVTLPSNGSMNVYPDNKKSNFTILFNTPMVLDGNYEVALANITCTPIIKNDYGKIIIKNSKKYAFLRDYPEEDIILNLSDTKNFQDKINNEFQEAIQRHEFINNTLIFNFIKLLKSTYLNKITSQIDIIYVFYDIQDKHTNNPNFYIPVNSSKVVWDKLFIKDNFICIKREDFYNQIPYTHKVVLLGGFLLGKYNNEDINAIMTAIINNKANEYLSDWENIFIKYYSKLLNSREDTGFTTLKAELLDNKIKLTSNSKLKLHAEGICKDLIFKNQEIELDKYYYVPGQLKLTKFGIIYCDIIQEQVFGEDYRQVLQVIALDSDTQSISNNMDLQYVPVKKNFINSINISIKSLTGEYIKFDDDFIYTIVKLHFRKVL